MLDKTNIKILDLLQTDQSLSIDKIGELVNLSVTPCWRRINKLKEEGFIKQEVALLNASKIGLSTEVIVMIKTGVHNQEWIQKFSTHLEEKPEIIGFYRMAGSVDYVIHVLLPNIQEYDTFYKFLIAIDGVIDVSGLLVMECIKSTHKIPLSFLDKHS